MSRPGFGAPRSKDSIMKTQGEPPRAPEDKLASHRAAMEWDDAAQLRAKVYARLMRAMVDEFGQEVLDIAENFRRESGQYCGDLQVDIAANERKYEQDPAILIREMDEMWHSLSADWGRTCICNFRASPDKRRHELYCVRCTYAEAFRSAGEEQIGITWCCWDMGYTAAFHPLFCQYMPMHMLKGDAVCYQIRRLADTPEQQARLNSIEHTGWRSWGKQVGGPQDAASEVMTMHKELFNDLPAAAQLRDKYRGLLESAHDADAYYALVQDIAASCGDRAYEIAEGAFADNQMDCDPAAMRTPGKVRRVGYAMEGINVYEVDVKAFESSMIEALRRLHNREMRKASREAMMTSEELAGCLTADDASASDFVAVAFNKSGQALGFVHCRPLDGGMGSIEALVFLPGRIHEHVGVHLRNAAVEFFKGHNITEVQPLGGTTGYALYRATFDPLATVKSHLPHIHGMLIQIQESVKLGSRQ